MGMDGLQVTVRFLEYLRVPSSFVWIPRTTLQSELVLTLHLVESLCLHEIGWRACNGDVTSDGQCTFEGGWEAQPTWSTWVSIHRRKATVFASRVTSQILQATDLQPTEIQTTITPKNFTQVFNGMLYPWKNTTQLQSLSPEWQLTTSLAISLAFAGVVPHISEPMDRLRNLFMAPLYAYNPVISGLGINAAPAIDSIQPGLHPENYISGSLAKPVNHLQISNWTKLVYATVGSFLIVLAVCVMFGSWLAGPAQETSGFSMVDFVSLTTSKPSEDGEEPPLGEEGGKGMEEVFRGCEGGDNGEILRAAEGVKVYSRRRRVTTSI